MESWKMDIDGFIDWLEKDEKSLNTIKLYTRSVKMFFDEHDELTKANMIAFKQHMIDRYSPATASLRCIAVNRYCEYIGKPECKVKPIATQNIISAENIISFDDYKKLLSRLKQDKNDSGYWMVKYFAETGMRVSELVKVKAQDVSKGFVETQTKRKIRRIYFPETLLTESAEYRMSRRDGFLFVGRYGKPLTQEAIRIRLQSYAKKYGIRKSVMHPHSFRHLYAIQFLKYDKDITLLADLMGHSNIATTARYTRLTAQEQMDRLNSSIKKWEEE